MVRSNRPIWGKKRKETSPQNRDDEGKRQFIQQFLQEYDIETSEDIQDAHKDLLGGTIKEMMDAEMDNHLGYEKSEPSDSDDYRNGYIDERRQKNSFTFYCRTVETILEKMATLGIFLLQSDKIKRNFW